MQGNQTVVAKDVANAGDQEPFSRIVYGIDYLGQGKSWPKDCDDGNSDSERGLRYCIYTWTDQIISFIHEIVLASGSNCDKVHIVGNSVGGHLAVILALKLPENIASIVLLNATPVWGLNLPLWSGHLPAPAIPRIIGGCLFDIIRDERTIEKYLEVAYANKGAFDMDLICRIKACTEGKGGHAAFTSILWSPPATFSDAPDFKAMLLLARCDVLLIFGQEDSWCTPVIARQMLQALVERKNCTAVQRYIELDNVGHCPNHEAPKAVAKLLRRWLSTKDRRQESLLLVNEDNMEDCVTTEPWGVIKIREGTNDKMQITSVYDRVVANLVG